MLKKDHYSYEENCSVCSLISLILDLKLKIDVFEILKNHFSVYEKSNLDVSNIDYLYGLSLNKMKNSLPYDKKVKYYSTRTLMNIVSNTENFSKYMLEISKNIDDKCAVELIGELNSNLSDLIKTNILKVIYYSNKINVNNCSLLFSIVKNVNLNNEQKMIVYEIIYNLKTVKTLELCKKYDIYDSLYIQLLLKNYKDCYYNEIHRWISNLKFDYNDSKMWYETEYALIMYFNKKKIDLRLLKDLKIFFKKGLSSKSRYSIVLILKKYNVLDSNELNALKYDSNIEIRRFVCKK